MWDPAPVEVGVEGVRPARPRGARARRRKIADNLVAFAPATRNFGDLALFTKVVVAQNEDGRLEVFTVADDGQVWHRWQQRADDPESW